MAIIDSTGTILVDDANLVWRRPPAGRGLEGLGEMGELSAFNWEGFGQAAAGIGGSIAAIVSARQGIAPIQPVGGIAVAGSGMGSSGSFSLSPQTMILMGGAALLLIVMMKR